MMSITVELDLELNEIGNHFRCEEEDCVELSEFIVMDKVGICRTHMQVLVNKCNDLLENNSPQENATSPK